MRFETLEYVISEQIASNELMPELGIEKEGGNAPQTTFVTKLSGFLYYLYLNELRKFHDFFFF